VRPRIASTARLWRIGGGMRSGIARGIAYCAVPLLFFGKLLILLAERVRGPLPPEGR
jgi:hypothetical protein